MLRTTSLICAGLLASLVFGQADSLPRRGALGAQLVPLSADELKSAGLKAGIKAGNIIPNLTAQAMQLKPGDILLEANKKKLSTAADLTSVLRSLRAGNELVLTILRDGKKETLRANLVAKPLAPNTEYSHVMSGKNRIRVMVSYPDGNGPFPTVFMIGGIGSYSMDTELKAGPYGNILEPLRQKGYAIVRTEKPGQGDSDGPDSYSDLLFDDELDAYIQSLRHVKRLAKVDKNRIAIFGHSMGGAFGPLVASQEKVAGVASCATMSKTWIEYNLENERRQMVLAGASDAEVDAHLVQLSRILHYTYNEGLTPVQMLKKYPKERAAILETYPDQKTYSGVGVPFFQQLAKKNLPLAWEKSNCKVLSMWGDSDFISTGWDQEHIARIVNRVHPGWGEYKTLKNADHGFILTTSFADSRSKWGRPGGTFNPEVISVLNDWLDRILGDFSG